MEKLRATYSPASMFQVPPILGGLLDEITEMDAEDGLRKLSNHIPLQEVDRVLTSMMLNVARQNSMSENTTYEQLLFYKARMQNIEELRKLCLTILEAKAIREESIRNGITNQYQ